MNDDKPPYSRLGNQRPDVMALRDRDVTLFNPSVAAQDFVLLDQWVLGFNTHYRYSRVAPCTAPLGYCESCASGWTPRWRGYVGAAMTQTMGRYLLPVTEGAWTNCPEFRALDGQLRGVRVLVSRVSYSSQAQVVIVPLQAEKHAVRVKPVDTLAVLSKIWGLDLRALDKQRPFTGDVFKQLRPYNRSGKTFKRSSRSW